MLGEWNGASTETHVGGYGPIKDGNINEVTQKLTMRTNKKVAIVILNWNGMAWMEKFLPSVLKYSPNAISEIIVADNGSTDNSLSMLSHKFPTVKIIRLEKNYGFAEGYNRAIKQVDTPYCVLLNSDVEVTEGWLDAPLALLEKEESIAAVQPKILSERNRHLF